MIKDLQTKYDILYKKQLCCYPPEDEAAKEFAKYMAEHPEYTVDDVNCRIDCQEREEDYYGNGGGVDRTLIIYKSRLETEEEYSERIKTEEDNIIQKFKSFFNGVTKGLKKQIEDLPSDKRVYKEITDYLQDFINTYNG